MITRLERLEDLVRQQEDASFAQWLRSLSDEELLSHITDELKTLSNEQLLRLYNDEPFFAVLK